MYRVVLLFINLCYCVSFLTSSKSYIRLRFASTVNDSVSSDKKAIPLPLIRNKIEFIVNRLLQYNDPHLTLEDIDPRILDENSLYLTKEGIFEKVMETRLRDATNSEDIAKLQNLYDIMGIYVTTERRKLARMKLKTLLEAFIHNRLEAELQSFSDNDDIDQELLLHVSSSIEKLIQQHQGGKGVIPEDISTVESDSIAVNVLQMIEKRLKAERLTNNKFEVRLLSKLLRETDFEARFLLLSSELKTIESITSFSDFLASGINYLRACEEEDYKVGHKKHRKSELPVGTYERMKDIQLDVEKLAENLKPKSFFESSSDGNPFVKPNV